MDYKKRLAEKDILKWYIHKYKCSKCKEYYGSNYKRKSKLCYFCLKDKKKLSRIENEKKMF